MNTVKIMVFLHGTAIMHRNAVGRTREERVEQSRGGDESLRDYAAYVPVDGAVAKLRTWASQGAEILYVSSHRRPENVEEDKSVLEKYGFPAGEVFFRRGGEEYKDIAERVIPDILIEDDCESIGGEQEMVYPHVKPALKGRIRSILVKEFGGIDHLADDVSVLV